MMKAKIELTNIEDVEKFTKIVSQVKEYDVRLIGKDENGEPWNISAKSIMCSLIMAQKAQNRPHTAHEVDWNTIWVECEKDIYNLIKDFVVVDK